MGKQKNLIYSSCSLSWKQKKMSVSPFIMGFWTPPSVLSITAVKNRGKTSAWWQWKKGFWNNPPSTRYCKRTSKLNKNCPHHRLLHWGENTPGWTAQFLPNFSFKMCFSVYSAIHYFKPSARIGKSVTKSHLSLKNNCFSSKIHSLFTSIHSTEIGTADSRTLV